MRKLITLAFLLTASISSTAFSQELAGATSETSGSSASAVATAQAVASNTAVQVDRVALSGGGPGLSGIGWIGVGTAATGLALFGWSFVEPQLIDPDARRAMLLRRATGAVVSTIGSGLVLFDVATRGSRSRLYVKFGSDAMPALKWQTRF